MRSETASGSITGLPTRSDSTKRSSTSSSRLPGRSRKSSRQALGVETLRPWDLSVDRLGRAALEPFEDVEKLAAGTEAIFRDVDLELGEQFAFLRSRQLLDLANRKGKAPGGYQTTLEDARLPFIFMNAVGLDSDLRTLLHEGGHAFHTLASPRRAAGGLSRKPARILRSRFDVDGAAGRAPARPLLQRAESDRSNRKLLEGIVLILPWIATVDAFQHWIYRHPDHTRADRKAAWRDLLERFGGIVD